MSSGANNPVQSAANWIHNRSGYGGNGYGGGGGGMSSAIASYAQAASYGAMREIDAKHGTDLANHHYTLSRMAAEHDHRLGRDAAREDHGLSLQAKGMDHLHRLDEIKAVGKQDRKGTVARGQQDRDSMVVQAHADVARTHASGQADVARTKAAGKQERKTAVVRGQQERDSMVVGAHADVAKIHAESGGRAMVSQTDAAGKVSVVAEQGRQARKTHRATLAPQAHEEHLAATAGPVMPVAAPPAKKAAAKKTPAAASEPIIPARTLASRMKPVKKAASKVSKTPTTPTFQAP